MPNTPNPPPPNQPPPNNPDVTYGPQDIMGGPISGTWSGEFTILGDVNVPAGSTLTVQGGSLLKFGSNVKLTVEGALVLDGAQGMVRVLSNGAPWGGIDVQGSLTANVFELRDATECITGREASSIQLTSGFIACSRAFTLANGATLDKVRVLGGSTNILSGGPLTMRDSLIDFRHPTVSPDCLLVTGGSVEMDYSQVTGCHCPFHVGAGDLVVTNSILDGAAYPVMIANSTARFSRNNFQATQAHLQDIGGNISADISDNYFEGGAPVLDTEDTTQFRGAGQFAATPFAQAGPR